MADIILDQLGLKAGDIFKQSDVEKIDSNATKTQDAINLNSNKIGVLTTNGITEPDLATAIKNDRSQLSQKASQSDLTITNTNVANNTVNIALKSNTIDLNTQKTRIDNLVATSSTPFYQKCISTDTGALLVVASGATTGQINIASVTPLATGYTSVVGDYVRLVYGVSSGSSELIDARTSIDGIAYSTVGNAVRNQFKKTNYKFNKISQQGYETTANTFKTTGFSTSVNFIGFGTCLKGISDISRIKAIIYSNNAGIAYCEILDGSLNRIAIKSTSVTALNSKFTVFDFDYVDTSSGDVWVRFYGDGTLIPSRNSDGIKIADNISTITNPYMYLNTSATWITTNQPAYTIPFRIEEKNYGVENTITVNQDGTGDFISIVDAVKSVTDSSETNVYNIYISEGTYDIMAECGGSTWLANINASNGELQGLLLPDYVNLIGVGNKNLVILQGHITDNEATLTNTTAISTLNLQHNNRIENLSISAYNQRYAVHDETNNLYHNIKRVFKDCIIEHLGNTTGMWGSYHALGCGTGSNGNYEYENCIFRDKVTPFLMHTNSNQKPNKLHFKNCTFIVWNQNIAMKLTSTNANLKHYCILDNCQINGSIQIDGDYWEVYGGGNSPRINYLTNATINNIHMSDETVYLINADSVAISKGKPVRLSENGVCSMFSATSLGHQFYGIALQDIAVGSWGYIQIKGFVDITGLVTGTSDGSRIGITTGALAVVTTDYFIGTAMSYVGNLYMRLK